VLDSASNSSGEIITTVPYLSVKLTSSFVSNSSLQVRAFNSCGDTSAARAIELRATIPRSGIIKTYDGTIDIAPTTNICSLFSNPAALESSIVKYTIRQDSLLVSDTAYTWTVSNSNMIIVGSANDSLVSVKFGKDFTTGILTIKKESGCGSSSTELTLKKVVPFKPDRIITKRNGSSSTPFLNVCEVVGQSDSVRYELALIPRNATSLNWSLSDSTHMEVVHGGGLNTTNNFISLKFRNNFTSGIIRVSSQNSCGVSDITNYTVKAIPPIFPAQTTITGAASIGPLCGSSNLVLTTSAIPTDSAINDYVWFIPTGIDTNSSITATFVRDVVGGKEYSTQSNSIAVDWVSAKTAKISVAPRSSCGTGKSIEVILRAVQAQPGAISVCRVVTPASGTEYDLSISAVTGAGGSTPYIWKVPAYMRIVSGQGTTTLRVRVLGRAPALTAVVTVAANNDCGTSLIRTIAYSAIRAAVNCVVPNAGVSGLTATVNSLNITNLKLNAYPNPTSHYFNVMVEGGVPQTEGVLRVMNMLGQLIEERKQVEPGQLIQLGHQYINGMYLIEYKQGTNRALLKLNKY
jgi:hypothetical protein